ncbi:hypothetical protein GGS24DRAFT_18477 [Hypoxylon argillaceum]|nr:hypothetical protein GGS24DRAFT_18477 [Hypoxylon argillaceum]
MMAHHKKKLHTILEVWLQICLGVVTIGLFAVIIVLVQASFAAQTRSDSNQALASIDKINMSLTLGILRLSQGILSALTTFLLDESFQFLQWTLISSKKGLSYASILGMSPTTGVLGMISLITSPLAKGTSIVWALLRSLLVLLLWISTLVLFFDTSTLTVYDTATTYNVTAGVGPFNGSYVLPFIDYLNTDFPTYPYNYFAPLYSLVNNPQWATLVDPLYCSGESCFSYLLSGGLLMTTPWMPLGYTNYPLVKIDNAPSIQMEFQQTPLVFDSSDCSVFGGPGVQIGIQLCLADKSEGTLLAGIFVCQYGTDGGVCNTTTPAPNITTEAKFFQRQATLITARSNYSVTNVKDLTDPVQIMDLDISSYRAALGWLLNFTAANIPAPSSIAENFWIASDSLRDPSYYGVLSQNFFGILAFPFWFFNANNYGNMNLLPNTVISTLSPDFYTQASLVMAYSRLGFNPILYHLFIALESILLLFFWIVLFWVLLGNHKLPTISAFPLFDFLFKCDIETNVDQYEGDLSKAKGSEVFTVIENTRLHVKS